MTDRLRLIRPDERVASSTTAGMTREEAVATETMWAGLVHAHAGMASGWHHHGDHDSVIYVESGSMRFEFGAGGGDTVEAEEGDFVFVPKGVVHRETNLTDRDGVLIVTRAGRGPATIDVDGPED